MRRLYIVLLAFLCASGAWAQSHFRHITVEEGLASNHVRSIIQDRHGFVWMGTDQGLHRYDGNDFKIFRLGDKCSGSTMLALLEDGGTIWIGTDQGVFRFSYSSEEITSFDISTPEGISITGSVNGIHKDKDGNLWFSTMGQGVFRYAPVQGTLARFPFPECRDMMANVYVDSSNQVWALTNWGEPVLSRLNKVTGVFEPFRLMTKERNMIRGGVALLEDSEQRFWLGTWDSGLYEIDRITGYVKVHLLPEKTGAGMTHIHSMIESAPGELMLASDDGILVYNTASCTSYLYTEGGDGKYGGLSNRFVYPLMKDREGSIWAGTYYGGVNYRSPFAGQIEGYHLGRSGGKVISRFCEDGDRNIWVASDDGGLNCYNPRSGRIGKVYDGNIHALCLDGDCLWFGTYSAGIHVMDLNTGKRRSYGPVDGDETSLDGTSSYSIYRDRDSRIWVSTMSGINLYDRQKDNFRRMIRTGVQAIDIDQDASGDLWFATQGAGVFRYENATNKWKAYRCTSTDGSLPSDYVNCVYIGSDSKIWFGTAKGLCRYDAATDSFIAEPLDISMENICGIVEDNNVMWMTTSRGLVRYENGGGIQVFTVSDGLLSNQFVPNSILKASDGRIYVGTTNGFNAFYPYQIRTNHTVSPVALTSLVVDNEEVSTGDPLLPVSLTETGRIKLSPHHNAISIRYSSLSYCVPYKNQYAYMLQGFDKGWNYVGNQRLATYTNLPAGTYTFLVKGTNNDAVWNEQPASLEITVRPPLMLSIPFKVFYALLIVGLFIAAIYIVMRINDRRFAREVKELEEKQEKEIADARVTFFTTIAHEIRTPVSLIIGPLEKIMKHRDSMPVETRNDLQIIDRNSQRLLFLVNQLLDFRKVEQNAMDVRFVTQPLMPLLHSVCERFEPTLAQNGARLVVECPADFEASVDTEAMTKLISNLLTNASKYTRDLVRLSCSVAPSDPSMFTISVYDNGCGISEEDKEKIFRPFYQTAEKKSGTGIGLSIVKSIAELHGGSIRVESEQGNWSEFIVTLPVAHPSPDDVAVPEASSGKPKAVPMWFDDILNTDIADLEPEVKPVILVVDDNEDVVQFLASTMSDTYSVLTATDGRKALALLESHPDVSLIVADWMMPEMDGITLCREVRANVQMSHIPFILLTAKTDDASKVEGMDCGADAYIEKPFSVQYLLACIKNQIALRTILRQRYGSSPLMPLVDVASTNTDSHFLWMMTKLIEDHFADSNLTVDFLTEQMGISRSSLYSKIKSLTNKTPNELIQLMRLKKAAQLLMERKYRISEVCYMVGFNSPSYFSKCFYRQFGMKPVEFVEKSTGEKVQETVIDEE